LSEQELNRRIRGSRIGFIPQDPYLALNPVFKVGTQLLEIMRWHAPDGGVRRGERNRRHRTRILELLRRCSCPTRKQHWSGSHISFPAVKGSAW
jgi:ABC-type dipeptide/oligopeptide/nickel transport system ATPase component